MKDKGILFLLSEKEELIAMCIKAVVFAITIIISLTLFFGDLRTLPPRVASLESRVAALELSYATGMTRIEEGLSSLKNDFNIVKVQITRLGMEHDYVKENKN